MGLAHTMRTAQTNRGRKWTVSRSVDMTRSVVATAPQSRNGGSVGVCPTYGGTAVGDLKFR
jgi:hypothetical protein